MRKHTVKIHGHHCEIRVYREGKHLWFAVGDYLGQEIKVQAENEGEHSVRIDSALSEMEISCDRAPYDLRN